MAEPAVDNGSSGLVVRRATGSAQRGLFGAGLCAISLPIALCGSTCLPDLLGKRWPPRRCRWLRCAGAAGRWGGALLVGAVLVKHSLVVFPVGLVTWALRYETRRGLLLAGIAGSAAGLLVLGGGLFPRSCGGRRRRLPSPRCAITGCCGYCRCRRASTPLAVGAFTSRDLPPSELRATLSPPLRLCRRRAVAAVPGTDWLGSNLLAELIVATAVLAPSRWARPACCRCTSPRRPL